MIKVAVIDDHVVVRTGLKFIISADPDFMFVGDHAGGKGAAQFVAEVQPDVTLLDVRMPDLNGVEALKEILALNKNAKVVMLTTSDAAEDIYRAIEIGALGYVMKESQIEVIARAIRTAMAGDVFMTDEVRAIYEQRRGMKGLSPRETEVMKEVAKGLGNREIAESFGISENSVKMHLKRAFFKLGAKDRTEAVSLARSRGMIS